MAQRPLRADLALTNTSPAHCHHFTALSSRVHPIHLTECDTVLDGCRFLDQADQAVAVLPRFIFCTFACMSDAVFGMLINVRNVSHRSIVQSVWFTPGTCVWRWTTEKPSALLHQLRRPQLQETLDCLNCMSTWVCVSFSYCVLVLLYWYKHWVCKWLWLLKSYNSQNVCWWGMCWLHFCLVLTTACHVIAVVFASMSVRWLL